jgi:thymidylate synthase (FAD)
LNLYKDEKTGDFMGYVELVDIMPRIVPKGRTGDVALVQGARVSYGDSDLRSEKADKGLVEYLVEHYHTSPLEMAEVKFICCCPLFVFNQLVRHRTANVNCVSRRYTEIPDDAFFTPELRVQSETNHQGSETGNVDEKVRDVYNSMYEHANDTYQLYKTCCDAGVGKEVARGAMPQNIMTSFVWKMDLHNFLKMVRLRVHHTAQKEIQELANAMYDLVKPKFPIACGAFEKFWLNSLSLSEQESEMIRQGKDEDGNYPKFTSKRRQAAFMEKLKKMGLVKD